MKRDRDYLIENRWLYSIENGIINYFGIINIFIWVVYIFGVIQNRPSFYLKIYVVFKILIALFLIYRFNPFRKYAIVCTELDKKMAYSAGFYILLFTFLDVVTFYIGYLREYVQKITLVKKIKTYFGISDTSTSSTSNGTSSTSNGTSSTSNGTSIFQIDSL
jgi:hypothetical protein